MMLKRNGRKYANGQTECVTQWNFTIFIHTLKYTVNDTRPNVFAMNTLLLPPSAQFQ